MSSQLFVFTSDVYFSVLIFHLATLLDSSFVFIVLLNRILLMRNHVKHLFPCLLTMLKSFEHYLNFVEGGISKLVMPGAAK